MKTHYTTILVTAAVMGWGFSSNANEVPSEPTAQTVEANHDHGAAEIAALVKRSEAETQGALAERSVGNERWYEAHHKPRASAGLVE